MKTLRSPFLRRGFSLVEILGVIAAIAVISSIGVVTITNTRQAADAAKLEQDVASVNRSIEIYRSNGGDLSGLTGSDSTTIDSILAKLKAQGESSHQIGVTSAMMDRRVIADYGDNSSRRRATWDASNQKFVVTDAATTGVVEFVFDESLANEAASTESGRSTTKDLATSGGWVWDQGTVTETAVASGNVIGEAVINPSLAAQLSHPNLTGGSFTVNADGKVTTDTKIYDEAGYSGELGIFSLDGMGNPPYDLTTAEGILAFMREAVRRVAEGGSKGGIAMSRKGEGQEVNFSPGTAVAFILIPNNTFAESLTYMNGSDPSSKDTRYPLTSLSFDTGNVSGFNRSQAVSLGNNVFAFEDMSGGGDKDYNDLIWKSSGISEPDWSSMQAVNAATYYSEARLNRLSDDDIYIYYKNKNDNSKQPPRTLRQALTDVGVYNP